MIPATHPPDFDLIAGWPCQSIVPSRVQTSLSSFVSPPCKFCTQKTEYTVKCASFSSLYSKLNTKRGKRSWFHLVQTSLQISKQAIDEWCWSIRKESKAEGGGGGGEVGEVMLMIVAEERHKSWDSKQNRKCV